jgi:hypothetical protein
MPTAKEQKVSTPLVLSDWSDCYRLLCVGDAQVADIELQRDPLRMPLRANYTVEGPDIVLALDP